jgi:hypothetical protein
MGFSFPLFLWMLAALAVPIVVHLLKFRPRQTLYFSDIRFLKETASTQARMHKLRDILLLLLRLLAIACLVLGFSMPFIKKKDLGSVNNEDRSDIYLFVDASLSMNAQEEEGNSWNGMFRALNAWLSSATQDESLFISEASGYFSAAHSPSQAWKMLNGMEPHIGAASPLSVYQKWINEGSKGRLIMISDMQRNQWEDLLQDSAHSRVMILPVSHYSDQRNLSIDSVWAEVPFTRTGLEQRLEVQVRNHSSKRVSSTIELLQNRRVENFESIQLDAGAVEILSLNFIPSGSGHAQLRLTDRSWSFDNIFHIAWNQGQTPRILIYDNGQAETDWPRIFPETEFESVLWEDQTEDAAGTTADLIVLADWTPGSGLMERVEQLAQSGADLVIWPSKTGAYPRFLSSLSNWAEGRDSGYFRGDLIDNKNTLFRSVFSRIPENPALPVDRKRNLLRETNGWRGMIQYEDGYLQLAQRQMGSSSLLLFAAALSPEWSHWAQEDLTLPLLHQASWRTQASNSLELKARPTALWTLPHPNKNVEQAIRAVDDAGRIFVPGQRRMAGSTQVVFGPEFSQPGIYALMDDQDSLGVLAVNPSFEERDLRFFDPAELPAEWQSQLVKWEDLELFGVSSNESDLWVILLCLGLLFLLIEGVVPKFVQP